MSSVTQNPEAATDWQQEIRALEERGRLAFLAGDTSTLDAMWDDRLLVKLTAQRRERQGAGSRAAWQWPDPPHHGRGRDRADRPLRRTP
jgi:hypothetical protein